MALPEPEQRPHPVIALFCFLVHSPATGSRRNSFQRLIGQPPLEEWLTKTGSQNPFQFSMGICTARTDGFT